MKETAKNASLLLKQVTHNENISLSVSKISPAYTEADLEELLKGLEVVFNPDLKNFFTEIGGLSLAWTVNKNKLQNKIPAEDIDSVAGSIQILNPFDMVMGKMGTKWKDVLWFDNMDEGKKQEYKSFIPFDFASTELIAGFKLKDQILKNEMYLYDSNNGIRNLNISLETYFDKLLITKGYYYWQEFLLNKNREEYDRFVNSMPLLFSDFDVKNL